MYPDLAFARAVRHDREKRKVSVRGSEQKEFKGKTSDSLRMMLGLNTMKMKAKDIVSLLLSHFNSIVFSI